MKKNSKDAQLNQKASQAMRQAVKKVIANHRRSGEPLIVWKNGKIVKIPSRQLKNI